MKTRDIILQLRATLPHHTPYFTSNLSVTSLTFSAGTVTAVTSAAHGLQSGEMVFINGAQTAIDISSLTSSLVNGKTVASTVTAQNHDLTDGFTKTVEIIGADQSEYNGVHEFIHQPNRRNFSYKITGTPASPATGTIKLIETLAYGYNGLHVITVINPTTFTYTVTGTYSSPALGTITAQKNIRVDGAISIERAIDKYTKQTSGIAEGLRKNQLFAFVVIGDHTASRDKTTMEDVTYFHKKGATIFRQLVSQPFSVYIFVPTVDSIGGYPERDFMEDVVRYIYRSLLRVHIPSGYADETPFSIITTGHASHSYTPAYYIHQINFESIYYLVEQDGIDFDRSVAFRDIQLQYRNANAEFISDMNINLDDKPI